MRRHKKLYTLLTVLVVTFTMFLQFSCSSEGATRLSETNIAMTAGTNKKLKLRQAKGAVAWSSSNKNIVSVNEKGRIYALKGGTAYIKAKTKKKTYKCKVVVVGFNKEKLTLSKKKKFTLKVRNSKARKWYSKNKKIATVTSKGIVKAKKSGKTTIVCVTRTGRKIKCKVYVPKLENASAKMVVETTREVEVVNTANACRWSSSSGQVASVDNNGTVQALKAGKTTIKCKTGNAVLEYDLTVINPNNLVTKRADLPDNTKVDQIDVTVTGYPYNRTYSIYKQNGKENISTQFPHYMQGHGCSASSLTTVLSAYAGVTYKPTHMIEKIEKKYFGDVWEKNYSKKDTNDSKSRPMPISLYGMTKILEGYGVRYKYVRDFSDSLAKQEIEAHLRTGNPVIFVVAAKSRKAGAVANKWTSGYHCMTMLGMTDTGKVIVADSVDRSTKTFGNNQRIKYASLGELIGYMFPCTNTTSTSIYWGGKASSGGYILINPQNQ